MQTSDGIVGSDRVVPEGRASVLIRVAFLLTFAGSSPCVLADSNNGRDPHDVDEVGMVESLPGTTGAHWVWIYDASLNAMPVGRAFLLDADTGKVLGSLDTGYSWVALALPRDRGEIYSAETYYSRHTRGTRTDLVSIYDPSTLAPVAEIELPPKRASTIPRLNDSALSDDDRFLAVFNLTPATSLSIVDLKARRFVEEVPIPGCSLAFPVDARKFFSPCFSGGILLTELGEDGAVVGQQFTKGIFDAEGDFIADNGARLGNDWIFPSLHGYVYRLSVSGRDVAKSPPWSFLSDAERRANWRMSGFQGSAIHRSSAALFLLVHQGGEDTYKDAGTEVWVYDIAGKKRVQRIKLTHPLSAIAVSQDDEPLLVGVDPPGRRVDVYSARHGAHLRSVNEIGLTPALVQFP
jgi:methylamine dehydrogenase heavy chain